MVSTAKTRNNLMLLLRCVEYTKVLFKSTYMGPQHNYFTMELPSLLSSRGLIFSFAFSKVTDVVKTFFRHEDVYRPHKPSGRGKGREREK